MAPSNVFMWDPCPLALPEMSTVAPVGLTDLNLVICQGKSVS